MSLDRTRVPPTRATLTEMLEESLEVLDTTVSQYVEHREVSLVATAAVTLRKLCHETPSQTPLFVLLEQSGEAVPQLIDSSPGEMLGFAVRFKLESPVVVGVEIVSPLHGQQIQSAAWRDWWAGNALSQPVDASTGWQAGRLSISRSRLATEWANRYGGAHVDERGSEAWFIDLVTLEEPASWAWWVDEHGDSVTALEWFGSPRDPGRQWHPLRVEHRALGHLVLARMAAEVLEGYGRTVPDMLSLTPTAKPSPTAPSSTET